MTNTVIKIVVDDKQGFWHTIVNDEMMDLIERDEKENEQAVLL